jgi:hypothetical protein
MSWISENKFLAGFGAVMLVGCGALGYLAYSASDAYSIEVSWIMLHIQMKSI